MSIIANFQSWKKVNEKKARVSKSTDPITGKKVKYVIWADPGVLRIKNVGFEPLLTNGKLEDQGQQRIKNSVNSDTSVTNEFQDSITDYFFKDNFFVYTVKKDTDNKEIITLVKTLRTTVPGFPENVNYITSEELKSGNYPKMDPNVLTKVETETNKPVEEAPKVEEPKTEETPKLSVDETKLPIDRAKIDQNVKNETVAKVQQLILDKFKSTKLESHPTFKKFLGYGADGKYGPTTRDVIGMIKTGFELSDKSGETITKELVSALETKKVTESYFMNYSMFEQFNFDAALSYKTSPSQEKKKVTTPAQVSSKKIEYSVWKYLETAAKSFNNLSEDAPVGPISTTVKNENDFSTTIREVSKRLLGDNIKMFNVGNDPKKVMSSPSATGDIAYVSTPLFGIKLYRKTGVVYLRDKKNKRWFKGAFTPASEDGLSALTKGSITLSQQKNDDVQKYGAIDKGLEIKDMTVQTVLNATDTRDIID